MMTFSTSPLRARLGRLLALASLLSVFAAAPAYAQSRQEARHKADEQLAADDADQKPAPAKRSPGEVSKITQELSQEIYSPFCPGKTLAMCPSGGASEVRQHIQEMARRGLDKQAIKDDVIDTYGEEFRMVEPPAQDNYALLIVLVAALALCIVAIYFFAKRRRANGADGDENGDEDRELSDDEQVYLEELRGEYMD